MGVGLRFWVAVFAVLASMATAFAQEKTYESKAPQAILIDSRTGEVLYEKDADKSAPPASMSKLMTQAIVFDLLKKGDLTETQEFTVSRDAHRRGGPPSGSSTMYANPDSKISIINLLRGAIIHSANDACIVLAEGIAGSEEAFVTRMNAKAKELGMTHSTFANATGLPDPNHLMSVRDLATIATYIQVNHAKYFPIYSEPSFLWNKIDQQNRNPLLKDLPGATGMKTGYTKEAGYGLVGTAERNGRALLIVINGLTSINDRRAEAQKLMEWGFRQFKPFDVYDAGETVSSARVWGGTERWVQLATQKPFQVALSPREQVNVEVKIEYTGPLIAPVQQGTEVGKVKVVSEGRVIAEAPVVTAGSVAAVEGMWKRAFDSVVMMIMGG